MSALDSKMICITDITEFVLLWKAEGKRKIKWKVELVSPNYKAGLQKVGIVLFLLAKKKDNALQKPCFRGTTLLLKNGKSIMHVIKAQISSKINLIPPSLP